MNINKTNEIENVLTFFKERFYLLNEEEIIKWALSKAYFEYQKQINYSDPSTEELLLQASKTFQISNKNNEAVLTNFHMKDVKNINFVDYE
ncbi:MAG: hypothetical protein ABII90_03765 [Bacteroidota bacterium]